jgi:hypothetical protein
MKRHVFTLILALALWLLPGCTPGPFVPAKEVADLSATISVTRMVMPTATPLPTLQPRPSYIHNTQPAAASTLSWYEYTNGEDASTMGEDASTICVGFDEGALIFEFREGGFIAPGVNFAYEDLASHVSLVVNSRKFPYPSEFEQVTTLTRVVDGDGNVIASYGGPATACWQVELDPGTHEAEFQFWHTSSVVETYRWNFALLDVTPEPSPILIPALTPTPLPISWPIPSPQPLPAFILAVAPQPAVTLSSAQFNNELCTTVELPLTGWGDALDSTLFKLNAIQLVGTIRESQTFTIGEPRYTAQYTLCQLGVVLIPGTYEALFQMETPSGELLQYHWFFTLTEP